MRNRYAVVPSWSAPGEPWTVGGITAVLQRGTPELLRTVDVLQTAVDDPDPYADGWVYWEEDGRSRKERFVAVEKASGEPLGVWLDSNRVLRLDAGYAYRVDFLMVLPPYRGNGIGTLMVRLLLERAKALGATRLVFHATETSLEFWVHRGAERCFDWKGSGAESQFPHRRLQLSVEALETEQLRLP